MLSDCIEVLTLERDYQERMLKKFNSRKRMLLDIGDKRLYANYQKNKLRYYLAKDGNMRKRRYIGASDTDLRKQIQERYYLERASMACHHNIETIDQLQRELLSLDPADVVQNAPLAYREQENAMKLVYGFASETIWKKRKLAYKSRFQVPYPENLKHTAGDGTITRSKSEALIIDLLNMKGIPYVYDYPLYLGNKLKWPDFIIFDRKNNRELLIEHLGKLSDEGYRIDQEDKLGLYIHEGYVPNVNLLLTFDDRDGNINVPAISRMIDAFLCK